MVNSSSCMQIPANMLRIYPVEALSSMKTHCIVLFKNPLAVHVAQSQGGGLWDKKGVVATHGFGFTNQQ